MNDDLEKKIDSIFQQALRFTEKQEREQFVTKVCDGNEYIYREVSARLAGHEKASFLDKPLFAPTPAFTLKQGDRLGAYEIIGPLGKGGMGEVYLACDLGPLKRTKVALKILPKSFSENPEMIDRFQREAQAASALNHPNILTIYDFGRHGQSYYIVSEFIEGVSLREQIGKLSIDVATDYARQLAQALERAHSEGIIHRDIKPENIMVRPDGYLKILDFGIAKAISLQQTTHQNGNGLLPEVGLTLPGLRIGTVNYMSPEQARALEVDARSDIWSWGVVLYEMLSGKRPFEASTPEGLLSAIRVPTTPPSRNRKLIQIVAKALREDPKDRYQSMAEALQDLEDMSLRDSGSRHLWWIATAVFILAGIIVFGLWPAHQPAPARSTLTTGNIVKSAISPNGDYVAYATQDSQGQALMIRQIKQIEPRERAGVSHANGQYLGITFSGDGAFIYYVIKQKDRPGKLFRTPVLTGAPTFIMDGVDSPISFSPDGSQFVFVRYDRERLTTALVVKDVEGNGQRELAVKKLPEAFSDDPLWSLDGTFVVCGALVDDSKSGTIFGLVSVDLKDRRERFINAGSLGWIGKLAWIHQGSSLAVLAKNVSDNSSQLLEVSMRTGRVSNISSDNDAYLDLGGSKDGQKLTILVGRWKSNIWMFSLSNAKDETLVATGRYFGVAWTLEGRIISQTAAGGHPDLWSINPKNKESHQLTDNPSVKQLPVTSSDGQYLVYESNQGGNTSHLWRSNQEGVLPAQFTFGRTDEGPAAITPDAKKVIFQSMVSGYDALWEVEIKGGGAPRQLTIFPQTAANPSLSPDGKWIACAYSDPSTKGVVVSILDDHGQYGGLSFPNIPTDSPLQWSPDGKALLYAVTQNGIANLFAQPIHGGKRQQVTQSSNAGDIRAFAIASDRDSVAYVRRVGYFDLDLITYEKY